MYRRRLFQNSTSDSKQIAVLTDAYEITLRMLGLVDRADSICEIVARKVIEIGTKSTHDPREIAEAAVQRLSVGQP
jgi:hypothetical protein